MIRNDNAVGAYIGRGARIFGIKNTFDDQWPVPALTDPVQVLPQDGGIEIGTEPTHVVIETTGFAQHRLEIAELVRTAVQSHIPGPAWFSERLQQPPQRSSWTGHP